MREISYSTSSRRSIRQSLDDIFAPAHTHNWNTGNLSQPTFKVSIVGGHNVDTMLHAPVDDTVVSVGSAVNRFTRKSFPSFIPGNTEGNPILGTKLFEFCNGR